MLTSEQVALPGGRTGKVYRAGQGAPVVWLHGPHGLRGHDPVVAELARRHMLIAPLAPGFADLTELDAIDSVHDLALYYDDVFDALDLGALTLIGHSFGAMAAAEYAVHYPRRVRKLVLVSPLGLWRDDQPLPDMFDVPYTAIDTVLWKGGKASAEMSDPADEPNNPVDKQVSLAQALTTVAKFTWPLPDRRLRRRLPRITAETLIISGADDRFVPAAYADDFAASIRGARKAVIADAAHMAPYEKPAEFFKLLDGFLDAKVRAA